jgi:PadR family transcriptional regulator PadR
MLDMPFAEGYLSRMKVKEHLLDGVPELLILRLVAAREMYGYQLVSEIQRRSAGTLEFGEGCIYPVLHRLLGQGMLSERAEEVRGRTRRYYRLSTAGQQRLAALDAKWQELTAAVAACGEMEVSHA